jgi:hypothetical protein
MVRFPDELFALIVSYARADPMRREQTAMWRRIRVERRAYANGLVRLRAFDCDFDRDFDRERVGGRNDVRGRNDGGRNGAALTIGRSEEMLRRGAAWLRRQ